MYPQITSHKLKDFFVLCLDFTTKEIRKSFLVKKVSRTKSFAGNTLLASDVLSGP